MKVERQARRIHREVSSLYAEWPEETNNQHNVTDKEKLFTGASKRRSQHIQLLSNYSEGIKPLK